MRKRFYGMQDTRGIEEIVIPDVGEVVQTEDAAVQQLKLEILSDAIRASAEEKRQKFIDKLGFMPVIFVEENGYVVIMATNLLGNKARKELDTIKLSKDISKEVKRKTIFELVEYRTQKDMDSNEAIRKLLESGGIKKFKLVHRFGGRPYAVTIEDFKIFLDTFNRSSVN